MPKVKYQGIIKNPFLPSIEDGESKPRKEGKEDQIEFIKKNFEKVASFEEESKREYIDIDEEISLVMNEGEIFLKKAHDDPNIFVIGNPLSKADSIIIDKIKNHIKDKLEDLGKSEESEPNLFLPDIED